MPFPVIYFLRHGQTEWNLEGRIQGRKDSRLTTLGQQQAQQQRLILAPIVGAGAPLDLFVSPLGRTRETSALAAEPLGLVPQFDPRLQEVDAGRWEGLRRDEVRAENPQMFDDIQSEFDLFVNAPGGEGLNGLYDRCERFLNDLKGPAVVVSHGVTGCVLRGLTLGLSVDEMDQLERGQGCVYRIESGAETRLDAPVAVAE